MNILERILRNWLGVLTAPRKTLRKESKHRNIKEAVLHLVLAGFLNALLVFIFGGQKMAEARLALGSSFYPVMAIVLPIVYILVWLLVSAVLYVFAHLLKGRGALGNHAYIMAITSAPFIVLGVLADAVPVAGWVLSLLVSIYNLYVLTIGLKEVHKYSTTRAVLTWLLPLIILMLAAVAFYFLSIS